MSNLKNYTIATIGSHSALDICRGAKDEGFKTLVIVEKGRDKTYAKYFKSKGPSAGPGRAALGCVDEVIYVDKFKDILSSKIQNELKRRNCIFIPHRSFEVYVNDYDAIENKFHVPVFGNKKLLRIEERTEKPNQYDLLKKADIKFPKQYKNYHEIDRLIMVKVLEKERGFERAFFVVNSVDQYKVESERLINDKRITRKALKEAVIEEYILGPQVNFNYFYSPIHNRLELIGTDTRRQTNLDGFIRLPGIYQPQVRDNVTYEEAGHIAVTILESLLEPAFEIGERFIKASQAMVSPGVIGPFALQTAITPGPPKKEIIVFDVSPRMPGSPGISATPYTNYLYGQSISMGRRVAMEIKKAIKQNKFKEITT